MSVPCVDCWSSPPARQQPQNVGLNVACRRGRVGLWPPWGPNHRLPRELALSLLAQPFHFTEGETEAQKGRVICPRSPSYFWMGLSLESGPPALSLRLFALLSRAAWRVSGYGEPAACPKWRGIGWNSSAFVLLLSPPKLEDTAWSPGSGGWGRVQLCIPAAWAPPSRTQGQAPGPQGQLTPHSFHVEPGGHLPGCLRPLIPQSLILEGPCPAAEVVHTPCLSC